jgi:hypothetical protein
MSKSSSMTRFILVALVAASMAAGSRDAQRRRPRRALPPRWSKDVTDVFFVDARTTLLGSRPSFAGELAAPVVQPTTRPDPPSEAADDSAGWSKVIAAQTLEDEVKAQKLLLDQQLTSLGNFKGGQYRDCRDRLSTLAVIFAIIAEYDGPVRWQQQAAGMRDRLARAGFNCKAGSDPAYREAKLRRQELDDLVRGDKVPVAAADQSVPWDQVTDVPSLMRRMALAHEQRLTPALGSPGEARRQGETIFHEAQILAALTQGLQREALDNWDDETYVDDARRLHRAALDMADGVRQNNYDQLRQAAGEVTKACSQCHEGYRG